MIIKDVFDTLDSTDLDLAAVFADLALKSPMGEAQNQLLQSCLKALCRQSIRFCKSLECSAARVQDLPSAIQIVDNVDLLKLKTM
jgi:hypothetical protein